MQRVAIRLRGDLRCQLQQLAGKPFFLVEDLVAGQFFRFGTREWALASLLDGKRCLADAVEQHQSESTDDPLSDAEAEAFVKWLVHNKLAKVVVPEEQQYGPAATQQPSAPAKKQMRADRAFSPFFIRIPLGNPDRLLTRLVPYFRWLASPWAFAIWTITCVMGCYDVASHWTPFVTSIGQVFALDNWFYLLLVWLLLKLVHEFSHGLFCKIYGGPVPRMGIALILFSPMAFVDVTSSWRFRRKSQRIMTAAAGIYAEFFIAAIAAMLWTQLESGIARQLCQNVIIAATATTVIFNANPLMRFDGYYILSDIVGIHNLYSSGQQFLGGMLRRFYFGGGNLRRLEPGWRGVFIRVYAVASALWRIVVAVSLATIAATMFHGAGVVLTIIAVIGWLVRPLGRLTRQIWEGASNGIAIDRRRLLVASLATAASLLLLVLIPWPSGDSAPAVVEYEPRTRIRVESAGFVREILVRSGDSVEPGQKLVVLENRESETKLRQLESQIEQSRIRSTIYHRDLQLAAKQSEDEHRTALEKQRDELLEIRGGLVINAPTEGRVLGRNLDTWKGRYVEVGTSLMAIGDPQKKQLRVAVSQENHEQFVANLGDPVWVRLRGRSRRVRGSVLMAIDPKATVQLTNAALASTSGGPLAVTSRSEREEVPAADISRFQLVSPRFTATVSIPEDESPFAFAGQLASVRVFGNSESIGQRLKRVSRRWLDAKLHRGG